MKQRERGRSHGAQAYARRHARPTQSKTAKTKSPAIWRGFRSSCCSALAVLALLAWLLATLLLLAWLLATLLLLAWLARLLATLLLLAGLRLLAGLIALLLLAWVLVGILILTHSISFQRWLLPTPTSR
jgi:hypothetical protein